MTTVLRRVRPWGSAPVDLVIDDDRYGESVPSAREVEEIDGRGLLALPGLINAHAHVDKSWVGRPWQSYAGESTTAGRIAHERAVRDALGIPSVEVTAATLVELLRFGTTSMRTHVDVDLGIGLSGIEAVRAAVTDRIPGMRYEIVAFPQDGVLRRPGVDRLLARAAAEGAEHIGGLDPAGIDRDPVGQLDILFGIAGEHGCGIDIHLHDGGSLGAFQIGLIIERTRALDLRGKVNLAHGFAMADVAERERAALLEDMAELGITLTTVAPVGRPALPARAFRAAGVPIGLGTDGFRDLWSPYGTGDLLGIAVQHARMTGARTDEELCWVLRQATSGGRRFIGAEDAVPDDAERPLAEQLAAYAAADFAPGMPADLILVDAENPMDALARCRPRELVMIGGRVIEPRTDGPVPRRAEADRGGDPTRHDRPHNR